MTTEPRPMTGYYREGADLAHLVGSIHPPLSVCGKPLEYIPLHQLPPVQVCGKCQRAAANTPPVTCEPDTEDQP